MSRAALLPWLLALLLGALALAALVLPRLHRDAVLVRRLRLVGGVAAGRHGGRLLPGLLRRIGELVLRSGAVNIATAAELQRTVAAAGFRGTAPVAVFVGAKAALLLLMPLLAWAATQGATASRQAVMLALAAGVGLLAPDLVLRSVRTRHRKAVAKGLPDALDLLVICAEAGLPLEAAVERVAGEMEQASPAIAAELSLTAIELRILSDRRTALVNMGERTGLEALRRLGGTLAQTLQYGTPLSQALRVLAAELRHEALMVFEARAARLPALLTLPTIIFILPCLFLVVGGPAMLRVLDLFGRP
ncbi:type II secretion system F family protein [Roseomonas sp. NAR14]|uniref:Type II secretion system F family protein n=1 Tax=Roseomonas acroporae TaxID=2937791 RepID=A0A9X1YGB2_9PROT|nr:type II secretion system F family protein [Roseomonas acroporae]